MALGVPWEAIVREYVKIKLLNLIQTFTKALPGHGAWNKLRFLKPFSAYSAVRSDFPRVSRAKSPKTFEDIHFLKME